MSDVVTIPRRLAALYLRAVLDGIGGNPQLLDWKQKGEGSFIVLAKGEWAQPYVTWYVGEYGAVEGKYRYDEADARDDFKRR